jgi:adenylylsulfate kinase
VPGEEEQGCVVWLTGLPCSGKSTLAAALALHLAAAGVAHEVLDGDAVRRHISSGLGFSREDRDTNVRRIGYVAALLARHGVVAIVAAVSPYRATREEVRRSTPSFIEVYVQCRPDICEQRDVKGQYARARAGNLPHFTGIDDPYEAPTGSDLTVTTDAESVEQSLSKIVGKLRELGRLAGPTS